MRSSLIFGAMVSLLIMASALIPPEKITSRLSLKNLDWLRHEALDFVASSENLESAIMHMEYDKPVTIEIAKQSLKACRIRYKHVAFFLEYFFPEKAKLINGPPKPEIQEPSMEYNSPGGLQVIEALLYDKDRANRQDELTEQARFMLNAVVEIPDLFSSVKVTDSQLIESFRLELIRIMTLYITGYDAPFMKTGIAEAAESLSALAEGLSPYADGYTQKDTLRKCLSACKNYLQANNDFNSFDRLFFLMRYALPLQSQVTQLAIEKKLVLNTVPALNATAASLFSAYALNKKAFPNSGEEANGLLSDLGRKLFFEKALSGDYSHSCASCHTPGKYFTDGMPQSKTLDGKNFLPRNTPGLLYSGYQYSQFWDGRAAGLKAQITTVLNNSNEMAGRDDSIVARLQKDSGYIKSFKRIWPPGNYHNGISIGHIVRAIEAYVQTLAPFQSPFDKYIQGDKSAMTAAQERGFNIFMGKGGCATCHFAPTFNGLTPPLYDATEYEILGTPLNDSLDNPQPDLDRGRYTIFPIPYYDGAFKTPTVRNAAVTGPYMHNGKFRSLDSVISFYDKGGGKGLGLQVPEQTLPASNLHLTDREKKDLISFIQALTDPKPDNPAP